MQPQSVKQKSLQVKCLKGHIEFTTISSVPALSSAFISLLPLPLKWTGQQWCVAEKAYSIMADVAVGQGSGWTADMDACGSR